MLCFLMLYEHQSELHKTTGVPGVEQDHFCKPDEKQNKIMTLQVLKYMYTVCNTWIFGEMNIIACQISGETMNNDIIRYMYM